MVDEFVEEADAVIGTGRGFGMILHAGYRQRRVTDALNRAVIERDVRDFDGQTLQGFGVDRVAVILRGDCDFAGLQIFDGLIGTAMTEFEFVSVRAHCQRDDLMAEAYPENRTLAEKFPDFGDDGRDIFWVAGAVRQKYSVGIEREDFFGGSLRRHDRHAAIEFAHRVEDIAFDSEIHRDDVERILPRVQSVAHGRRYLLDDIPAHR